MFEHRTGHMFPMALRIAVGAIFALSVLFIFIGHVGVILFSLVSGAMLFCYSAVKVDTQQRFYKEYISLAGMMIPLGNWKHLPALKMVSVLNETMMSRNNMPMGGAQSYSSEVNVIMNLVSADNRFRLKIAQGDGQKLLQTAKKLAKEMNLDVLDARNPRNKVMIPNAEL